MPTPISVRVVHTLLEPAIDAINFVYFGLRLHTHMYHRLALAINRGDVAVYVAPAALPEGAAAGYVGAANAMILGPTPDPIAWVHEATHAVADRERIRRLAEKEEAAAYLASTVYAMHGLTDQQVLDVRSQIEDTREGRIIRVALELVYRFSMHARPGAVTVLDDEHAFELREAVRSVYWGTFYEDLRHRYEREGVRRCNDRCNLLRSIYSALASITASPQPGSQ